MAIARTDARRRGRRRRQVNGRLRRQIESLDQQIDQGAERALSAPENLVGTLYAKIEELQEKRDRLNQRLGASQQPETAPDGQIEEKIQAAEAALRDLAGTLKGANPAEVRELFQRIIVKVEVQFVHERKGSRDVNSPVGGIIVVRPPAESSILFTNRGS